MEEMQPHTPTVMSIQQVAAFLGVSRIVQNKPRLSHLKMALDWLVERL